MLKTVEDFHGQLESYFEKSHYDGQVDARIEKQEAKLARSEINFTMNQARQAISEAGVKSIYQYTPPSAIGGLVQNVDIVENVFTIGQFQISSQDVLTLTERAIGVYRNDISSAWRRTFNPFWWIMKLLGVFVGIPFILVRAAGFDERRFRDSAIGKLIALVLYIIPIVASALIIMDKLDLLEPFKQLFKGGT